MDLKGLMNVRNEELLERIADMSSIRKVTTGLDVEIWVETNGKSRQMEHNLPRLKFVDLNDKNKIPVTISKEPELLAGYTLDSINISAKQFNTLKEWIVKNYDALMDLWNGDIATDEFIIERMEKV